jgi:hypothetical protein
MLTDAVFAQVHLQLTATQAIPSANNPDSVLHVRRRIAFTSSTI